MGILELMAGQSTSPLDIARAGARGEKDRSDLDTASLNRRSAQAELTEFLDSKEDKRSKRKNNIRIQELKIEGLEGKGDSKDFSKMMPLYAGNKLLGYGQVNRDGRIYNKITMRQLNGFKSNKMPNVGEPSKDQIKISIQNVKNDEILGESGGANVGFDKISYDQIGRAIASRARQLKAQTKYLNEGISDVDAMSLAKEEFIAMEGTVWDKSGFGYDSKTLLKDITFGKGLSSKLLNYLGVDAEQVKQENESGDVVTGSDGKRYEVLSRKPDGSPDSVRLMD